MSENKEKVGQNQFVAFTYKVYDDASGDILFEVPQNAPDTMIYGVTPEIAPGLIEALRDLGAGDRFSVTLPPAAGFGERYDENVITLENGIFMRDGKMADEVKIGAELPMMTQDGMMVKGRVIAMDQNNVTMDFNHPFAGLTVRFEGEVVAVRPATDEELHPAHHCCGGGCHGSCGDSSCDCDSNEGGCDCDSKEGGCDCDSKEGGCDCDSKEGGCDCNSKEGGCDCKDGACDCH